MSENQKKTNKAKASQTEEKEMTEAVEEKAAKAKSPVKKTAKAAGAKKTTPKTKKAAAQKDEKMSEKATKEESGERGEPTQTAAAEEAPAENKADTARQAVLEAFSKTAGGTGTIAPIAVSATANKGMQSKKIILWAVAGVLVVALVVVVFVSSQKSAQKQEALQAQMYQEKVLEEAKGAAILYHKLQAIASEETTLIATINAKQKANAKALSKWENSWKAKLANYDKKTREVEAYNEREQSKSNEVVGYTTDYWGYSSPEYYQPKRRDYPNYPNPPKPVKVDVAKEIKLLTNFKASVEILASEITSSSVSAFPFAPEAAQNIIDVAKEEALTIESTLTDSDLITMQYFSGNDDMQKGMGIDATKLSILTPKVTQSLVAKFEEQFDTLLAQYGIPREEVGLAPKTEPAQ